MNGLFDFDTALKEGMFLSISSVGCKTTDVFLPCDTVIYIESTNELAEVVVRGSKRYVKGTPRGLQISMAGNPIAKLGNAMEAIKHLPMIDASGGGISVLGHGTPVVYINNRLVRSTSELSSLSADDISNVEIITNPSSKYGADVSSVILIRTKKLNKGFHAVAAGNVSASEEWSESADVSLNYHTESGLTVLGDLSYGFSGFKQDRHYVEGFYSESNPESKYRTDTYSEAKSKSQSLMADAGLNYDFGNNSIGAKYMFQRTPKSHYCGNAKSVMDYQGIEDVIASISDLYSQSSMHHVNTFGSFALPANIGLRIDADYVKSYRSSNSGVDENNSTNMIYNSNVSKASLWSGKIVLSRKIGKVEIEAGSEISYTRNNQDYLGSSTGNQDFIAPETDNVKQNLYAGFVGFDWTPNTRWNIYGGLRLESTNTDFRQNNVLREDLSKSYTDLLPNLGISFNSSVRMTLFYRASVSRPGYQSLDNTYVYVTPTLWETGNPELRSTLRHKIGLNLYYKKFILQSSFTMNKRNITSIYRHDNTDHINVVQPVNLPDYNSFQLVAVQQLDFGFWHPTIQGVFYVQDLKYGSPVRKYDKPLYILSLNNRFDIPGSFYAYFNLFGLGTGNQDVIYSRGSWQASVTLNKTWKNWTFTLSANDIFNTWRQKFDTFTNTVDYSSDIKGASRSIALSIRYTLNAAKGKYKGKTSRQDEIDRL
ncbi:outer membrane beta-barrel family protein [Prevotella sp. KH2C16]|uniref:outer membrane beta-barrel family protein n=1 Tax=Prevotella sp. KH2C16 TaxID=1855325 RepID=UPI0021018377|nr:outer membrane beta-barrel family protein [Prevotella sp. KH2C16]